ncbi:unnamed protein product, partial [Discosporangium mesarthrocarpum]
MQKRDYLERVIRRFIAPPILFECEAEEGGWFAEIHRVAVVFVNIDIRGLPSLEVMQSAFRVLQRAMISHQGVIKEFSVDDKGTVMVGALGLPPISGSNPAGRACTVALKIMEGLEARCCSNSSALGVVCYIGISMGPVFTATIGGTRREFAMVGDVVNTAARLMSAGKKLLNSREKSRIESLIAYVSDNGGAALLEKGAVPKQLHRGITVTDAVTASQACTAVDMISLGEVAVKGKSFPIEIYSPV